MENNLALLSSTIDPVDKDIANADPDKDIVDPDKDKDLVETIRRLEKKVEAFSLYFMAGASQPALHALVYNLSKI
jgi:hypothetical protein